MATSEERLKILKMIQDGKITASEGMQLLQALGDGEARSSPKSELAGQATRSARWFRVRVTDTNTGKVRVNVRMPVSVLTAGFKLGARFSPEIDGVDAATLMDAIRAGETGLIADVLDEKDGEHVEVFLE